MNSCCVNCISVWLLSLLPSSCWKTHSTCLHTSYIPRACTRLIFHVLAQVLHSTCQITSYIPRASTRLTFHVPDHVLYSTCQHTSYIPRARSRLTFHVPDHGQHPSWHHTSRNLHTTCHPDNACQILCCSDLLLSLCQRWRWICSLKTLCHR